MTFFSSILQYIESTPADVIAAQGLLYVGWIPIFGVVVWGLIQVWLDQKQGQYAGAQTWHLLAIDIPAETIQTPKGMENFFNVIAGSKSSITWKETWLLGKFQPYFSLEIVSVGGNIQFYIRSMSKYKNIVEAALYSQYPDAQITEVEDYAKDWPEEYPNDDYDCWGSMFVPSKPNYMPLKTYEDFEHQGEKDQRFKDPILPILELMGQMKPDEIYAIQILIMQPDGQDEWRPEGEKYIMEKLGKGAAPKKKGGLLSDSVGWIPAEVLNQVAGSAFGLSGAEEEQKKDDFAMFRLTPQEQDQVKGVAKKISKLGWWSKIRFVYISSHESYRKGTIASISKGIFHQYANLNSNKLGLHTPSTPKDDYFYMEWQMPAKQRRIVKRYKDRSFGSGANPFILNSEELATLFHFPSSESRTPVLRTAAAKRGEAPPELSFVPDSVPTINTEPPEQSAPQILTPQPLVVPRPGGVSQAAPQPQPAAPQPVVPRPPVPVSPDTVGVPAPLPPGVDTQSMQPSAPRGSQDDGVPMNLPI